MGNSRWQWLFRTSLGHSVSHSLSFGDEMKMPGNRLYKQVLYHWVTGLRDLVGMNECSNQTGTCAVNLFPQAEVPQFRSQTACTEPSRVPAVVVPIAQVWVKNGSCSPRFRCIADNWCDFEDSALGFILYAKFYLPDFSVLEKICAQLVPTAHMFLPFGLGWMLVFPLANSSNHINIQFPSLVLIHLDGDFFEGGHSLLL